MVKLCSVNYRVSGVAGQEPHRTGCNENCKPQDNCYRVSLLCLMEPLSWFKLNATFSGRRQIGSRPADNTLRNVKRNLEFRWKTVIEWKNPEQKQDKFIARWDKQIRIIKPQSQIKNLQTIQMTTERI